MMGMAGVIVAGNATNKDAGLAAIKEDEGKAAMGKDRYQKLAAALTR